MGNEDQERGDQRPTLVLEREVVEAYQRMTGALGEASRLMTQFGEALAVTGRAFEGFLGAYERAYGQPLRVLAAASPKGDPQP